MGLFDRLAAFFGSARADLRQAMALIDAGKRPLAFKKLSRAARAGLAEAEYQIARSYLEGAGVPPSQMEGLRWLERAATQGFVAAQSLLAAFYVQGAPVSGPDAAPRRVVRPAWQHRCRVAIQPGRGSRRAGFYEGCEMGAQGG